jgi:DNA repair protein RadC
MKVPQFHVSLVRERTLVYRKVDNQHAAAVVLHALLDDAPTEKLVVLYLNGLNGLIGAEVVAIGGVHVCPTIPKDVFRGAIVAGAAGIILGHNHPSGDPTPSLSDVEATKMLAQAGKLLGVAVLDHVVVSGNGKDKSMLDLGLID